MFIVEVASSAMMTVAVLRSSANALKFIVAYMCGTVMKNLNHGSVYKCLKIYHGLCLKRYMHNGHLGKNGGQCAILLY
uniref:Uncharacterized protein n=1 Tax=Arundo donax TaxID=35708 RepID=A0A0A8YQ72_ARUDO